MNKRLVLTCWGSLLLWSAVAQYKNVEIATLPDGAKRSIPTAVVSRKDAKFVVVRGANNTFYLSNDSGATWETVSVEGMERAEWMSIVSDSRGSLYAIYTTPVDSHYRVMLSQSKDNGRVWSSPIAVSSTGTEQKYPSGAFDVKGNLYITWTETGPDANGKCESAIMLTTTSNGSKWSKPHRVSLEGGDCEGENSYLTGGIPAIAPDGKAFVSWCNKDKIYMDRSFANSMWLENDIQVNTINPGWKQNVPGYSFVASPPQLLVDQTKGPYHGCIYLAWSDQRSGDKDTDVLFTRSNNYGDNWSSPSKLGAAPAGTEQYGARMAIDQATGYIYVLFYDRGKHEDDQTDVVLAYSSESGGSFKTVTVSDTSFVASDNSGAGVYLDIAAHAGVIVPVWTRTQDGKTSLWSATIRQDELIKPAEAAKGKKKK